MKQINNDSEQSAFNKEVRLQYYKLLKQTTQLIATLERHELRFTLQRTDKGVNGPSQIAHEFISPIVYLALKSDCGERFSIWWGIEQFDDECDYSHITSRFVRLLYKLTSIEETAIDIEQCINTDCIVTHCSYRYECIEENNRYHQFVLIKHKPAPTKRKRMQAVA